MHRLVAMGAACAVLAVGAAAQQRRPLLGTVVDGDGRPLAGATVQVALVPRGFEDQPAVDHATATTDGRGRFRVDVLPHVSYQAWALGPEGEGGARLTSDLVQAAAGHPVELRAAARRRPFALEVTGLAAWAELAPFTLRLVVAGTEVRRPLVAEGTLHRALLPPLPGGLAVELLDAAGEPLGVRQFALRQESATWEMLPPQVVPMRVVDGKGGPIAGARIVQRLYTAFECARLLPGNPGRDVRRLLGTTGPDGTLAARVPCRADPFQQTANQQLTFVATAPGLGSSLAGFRDLPFCDGTLQARDGTSELRFTLGTGSPLRGRLVAGGEALAGVPVVVRREVRIQAMAGRGWQGDSWRWRTVTAADGTFTIDGMLPEGEATTLLVAAGAERDAELADDVRRTAPPHPVLLHRFPQPVRDEVHIDLRQLCTLRLRILDEGKGPPRGVQVLFVSRKSEDCDEFCPQAAPDSAGRLAVRVQPGPWLVFARNETGWACQELDVAQDAELAMELAPMPVMRGRVVDGDGRPVAGATLGAESAHFNNVGTGGLQALAQRLNWTWIGNTRSEADGSFACRFLDLPGITYQARFQVSGRRSERFPVEVSEGALVPVR